MFWFLLISLTCSKPAHTVFSIPQESNHYIFPVIQVSAFCHPLLFWFFFFLIFMFKSSRPENLGGFEIYPGSDLFTNLTATISPPTAPGPEHCDFLPGWLQEPPPASLPLPCLLSSAVQGMCRPATGVDALHKTQGRSLDDSSPLLQAYQRLPLRMKAKPSQYSARPAPSPVFSPVYCSLTFSDLRLRTPRSPGTAVSSGGHLARTPWPWFRYRFNSGPSLNI